MTDHTDALWGITQATLDDCDPAFSSQPSAWLAIGRMHGVSISIEIPSDARRRIPKLARDGVVLRFPIPRGADFVELAMGLGEGGELSALIDAVLDGHFLALSADGASGYLTHAAALARDDLLDAIGLLERIKVADSDRPGIMTGVWPMRGSAAAPP